MTHTTTPLKISIVTASFNQGRFIETAIRSVLDQGYSNFEHIIFDNNSNDETHEVVSRYSHVRFISEPDEGQSDALNKGFLLATGDIIGWLNADDYYLPNTFSKVEKAFRDSRTHAIYSNVKFVNSKGNFIRNLKSHRPLKWMSLFYTYIQSTSFFFRREIIQSNHLLDKSLYYQMDMEYFARLLFSGYKFKYINDYFACFRWHDDNKTNLSKHVQQKHLRESFYIINKLMPIKISQSFANAKLYNFIIHFVARPIRQVMVLTRL